MIHLALTSPWNWTEVSEGVTVSLLFVLGPILWRVEKHHRASQRRHDEHDEHLKDIRSKL